MLGCAMWRDFNAAQELFSRNISTSCFGVGADYDEHMLEAIANHGGNFHFLRRSMPSHMCLSVNLMRLSALS